MSLSDIAGELHLTPNQISRMLDKYFKREAAEIPEEERKNILAMENDRLNYYLSKLWPSIEYGDIKAITLALGIHDRLVKVNRLDIPDAASNKTEVLVIGGEESEYIAALKAATSG